MRFLKMKIKLALVWFGGLTALAALGASDLLSTAKAQPPKAVRTITLPADKVTANTAKGSIFFIGNATVLIRYGGLNLLTDPNFIHKHEEVPIGYGLEATRLKNPAIDIDELPLLDLVVLSHFHGDHFDPLAEQKLDRSLPIVTTPEAAEELKARGFKNARPLGTWSWIDVVKRDVRLRIAAMPGRHGPPLSDLVLPEVMGTLLDFRSAAGRFRLYITGDTLAIAELKQIARRYPRIDLALLHLGGTEVLGIMLTMDGAQGVHAMRMTDPEEAIPIHYEEYDIMKSPLEDFKREVRYAGLEDKVRYLNHGDTYRFELTPPGMSGKGAGRTDRGVSDRP